MAPETSCANCGRAAPSSESADPAGWEIHDDGTALCPDCVDSSETAAEEDAQTAEDARRGIHTTAEGGSLKLEGEDV
jgi:hypothetical protein